MKGKLEKCGYFLIKQQIPQTGFQGCFTLVGRISILSWELEFKGVRSS